MALQHAVTTFVLDPLSMAKTLYPRRMCFAADGKQLVIAAQDRQRSGFFFVDLVNGTVHRVGPPVPATKIMALSEVSGGSYRCARVKGIDNDGTISIWNVSSGQCEAELRRPDSLCRGMSFTALGTKLVCSYADGVCVLWDVATGVVERVFEFGTSAHVADTSVDGTYLAVGGSRKRGEKDVQDVAVWNLHREELPRRTRAGSSWIHSVGIAPNNELMAVSRQTLGSYGMWHVYQLPSLELKWSTKGESFASFFPLFTPDSTRLCAEVGRAITIRNASTGELLGECYVDEFPIRMVSAVAISGAGTLLAAGYEGGAIRLWDIR